VCSLSEEVRSTCMVLLLQLGSLACARFYFLSISLESWCMVGLL
jgi:hypothetical protein